ncbi:PqiC family protein [Zoogloea sp.]|uniref:PqiC family protein n=1 Tax=Zoogloea sp. TaxID=49181 RepID=UPI0014158DA5|nr:MAG: membrane integrity-associated transporter subunit PqiC [Zoogloea sp.]
MRALPLILSVCLLAACGTTPPVRYYTLGSEGPAGTAAATSGPSLVVGPVGVPAAIDRLLIVRQVNGVRAEVAEGHRWAAPLKTEIARRVAVELARSTGNGRIVAWPQGSIAEPDMSLPIDVLRFEADGFERVTLEAVWTLRKAGKELASGRFAATEPITEPGWDGLAAAHGRLVTALARDVARTMR